MKNWKFSPQNRIPLAKFIKLTKVLAPDEKLIVFPKILLQIPVNKF